MFGKLKLLTKSRFLMRRLQAKFVIETAKELNPEKKVLDLGAGRSQYKKFFKEQNYLALDVEDRTGGTGNVIITDANKGIPLEDNSIDYILCIEVLEHLKEPAFVMQEIYRVLKPGGKLVLTTPFVWFIHEAPNDFFRYTKFGLEHLLKKAGFETYKVSESNNKLYTFCQLLNSSLRSKFFIPLVFVLNILGFLSFNTKPNDFPLEYYIMADK